MAFLTKIFKIVVSNSYYSSVTSNDFEIQPTHPTKNWLNQRKIRIINHSDGIELVWLSENYDNPLELLQKKANHVTASFVMTLKNSQVLNVSELEVGQPMGKVYYFHNKHNKEDQLLHPNSFISEVDLVDIAQVQSYPNEPGWDIFAIIDIEMSRWFADLSRHKHTLFTPLTITYEIKIQNRATFWRYCVVDTQKQLNGKIKVESQGDVAFEDVKFAKEPKDVYYIESTHPIPLYDRYDSFFSLCQIDKGETNDKKVLIEKLPYPTYDSLKKDKKNQKKYYSDIVVYV